MLGPLARRHLRCWSCKTPNGTSLSSWLANSDAAPLASAGARGQRWLVSTVAWGRQVRNPQKSLERISLDNFRSRPHFFPTHGTIVPPNVDRARLCDEDLVSVKLSDEEGCLPPAESDFQHFRNFARQEDGYTSSSSSLSMSSSSLPRMSAGLWRRHLPHVPSTEAFNHSFRKQLSFVPHAVLGARCRPSAFPIGDLHHIQMRGLKIQGSEVKLGNVLERRGRLLQVVKVQHTHHGRGGATIQLETRDLQSGVKSNERLRSSEEVERVRLYEREHTFLYVDGDDIVLMDPATFEQVTVPKTIFGGKHVYLTDGMTVVLTTHGETDDILPLVAAVPLHVTLRVVSSEPYSKGQTATPMSKPAILENGVKIQVPSFVVAGDYAVVNTSEDSFVRRGKAD